MANRDQRKTSTQRSRRAVAQELLELVQGRPMSLDLVSALAGDRTPTAEERNQLNRRRRRRRAHFYSDVLFAISHEYFAPERARAIWTGVLKHKKELDAALGRRVGVTVAALDYFTNVRSLWDDTALIRPKKLATVAEVALVDGLTGLLTRSTFIAKMQEEVRRAERYGDTFSVVLLDLDDFKSVNDTHGHAAGDEVLEEVGAVIRRTIRDTDVGARYGGEEFVVLLPRISQRESIALAERLRANIEESFSSGLAVTASLGVASFPKHGDDPLDILKAADKALYHTKRTGKNGVTVFPRVRQP